MVTKDYQKTDKRGDKQVTKTILELANELEVTKQAIQYQMKKIDDQHLSKRPDGAYLISVEGQNLIRKYMGFEIKDSDKRGDKDHQNSDKITDKDLLDDTITILQKELEEKNDQIESLQELLKEQQNLLSQQQQLSLQSNQQIQYLQLELSKDSKEQKNDIEVNKKEINKDRPSARKSDDEKLKKGFFSRLFDK